MKTETESSVVHGGFTLEHEYKASPAEVFAAFAKAESKRRWFVEGKGWEMDDYTADFRVLGRERSRFRFVGEDLPEGSPPAGTPMSNDTVYLDIVPDRRIVFAYSMSVDGSRSRRPRPPSS